MPFTPEDALIIEFAKQGERDPVRLRDLALKTVRPE
jgi:hypothetical protein